MDNYVLAGKAGTSRVGLYVQVHGKKKAKWQLLSMHYDFSVAKAALKRINPDLYQSSKMRALYADGCRNWALFYTTYRGEPVTDGRLLGKLHVVGARMQMEEVE